MTYSYLRHDSFIRETHAESDAFWLAMGGKGKVDLVCCSVLRLQCVAVAVCCSALQLQCVAACCCVLHCAALCCRCFWIAMGSKGKIDMVCCSVLQLQCVAECCSCSVFQWQCVAVCCSCSVLYCFAV